MSTEETKFEFSPRSFNTTTTGNDDEKRNQRRNKLFRRIQMDIKVDNYMDQQTGRLINLFDFRQPITDVYCGQLTNRSAQFFLHSIYNPSLVNFHG